MTGQIEVVEINDDNNEENAVVPLEKSESTEDTENVKIPESFILEADFNEIADKALQEDSTQPAIRAPEVRPKSKARKESILKDKTTCPDCGKPITIHALKYTHKRYCKATTKSEETKETITPDIEDNPPVRNPCPFSSPLIIPTSEQIAAFLTQDRKMKAEKKRARMNNLISHAF